MANEIMVSVICMAYNHEKYIRRCLDGFVNQKTNFKYEVLINDDASTDKTADIIREYEMKYPEIIKPIYQTENQYSQGVSIVKTQLIPRTQGIYIASCEGDDYWIDNYKLQKQFDFMESHPEYSMCVHRAIYRSVNNEGSFTDNVVPKILKGQDFNVEDTILGGGALVATNSMFRRKELFLNMPSCFKAKGFSDYQTIMYATMVGKLYCFEDVMSVYNYCTPGSWTSRVWSDSNKKISHLKEENRMLNAVDDYYEKKYHTAIEKKIHSSLFKIYQMENNKKMLKSDEFVEEYRTKRKSERKKKIIILVENFFPFLFKIKAKFINHGE